MPLTLGYALAFWATHRLAASWGGRGFYSLWFPAAGVRLALLWRRGPGFTPLVVLAELGVQFLTGVIDLHAPGWPDQAVAVARPALAYGAAVALVQRLTRSGGTGTEATRPLSSPPMPFGLATVLAPTAAVLASLPWTLWHSPTGHGPVRAPDLAEAFVSLTGFLVGDLLGVLLVAPPLLWLAEVLAGEARPIARPRPAQVLEAVLVLAAALGLAAGFGAVGLGLPETPVLLAAAWIGLRFGRTAAWAAIVVVAALVLPWTANHPAADPASADARIDLHLGLAGIVVAAYLAGSFADAQARATGALARRDRLLFQAERLKTLRAMSVAIIHEISQPLSTLAIEARHLHELSVGADVEVAQAAALVDRKAAGLADLVRRLRRFGGRAVDEPAVLPVALLLESALALVRPEAKAAQSWLRVVPPAPDLVVTGQEVELAQALLNLLRNAVQACEAGGSITVSAARVGGEVAITVANPVAPTPVPRRGGMGVGALVARAIVEAHGGRIEEAGTPGTAVRRLVLPATEAAG